MSDAESGYTLRHATEADYDWLRRLHHAAMRESVERIWGWDDAQQDAYFRAHFDPSRQHIVQVDGRNVGMVQVERRPDELFLADLQIGPTDQSKGIGTALIRALQEQARAEGVPLTLQVNCANRARALYERLGFVITGDTATHHQMHWVPGQPPCRPSRTCAGEEE